MPLAPSSRASALLARPRVACWERTSIWAYASSSTRPTWVIRSRTVAATSTAQPRCASFSNSAELLEKLAQRGCAVDVAATVLDRMTQVGLVDDEAYAQMLVRSQQATRGLAKSALARELGAKGIENYVADEALALI